MYTEPGERALVCSFENKADIMKSYTVVWDCIKPEEAKLAEFNDKLKTCMQEKARKEEEEFAAKAG